MHAAQHHHTTAHLADRFGFQLPESGFDFKSLVRQTSVNFSFYSQQETAKLSNQSANQLEKNKSKCHADIFYPELNIKKG